MSSLKQKALNRNPRKGPTIWNRFGGKPNAAKAGLEKKAVLSNPNAKARPSGGMGKMG